MTKLNKSLSLIMLFLFAFSFSSTAQLQAKVKSEPITGGGTPCIGPNPDGTFTVSIPLKLNSLTFDDCENGYYSGINNLPCDLHVGLTNLESGETYYTSVNASSYQPVGHDSTLPGDVQDYIMDVDCSDELSPFEVSGFYTEIQIQLPANSAGSLRDCDDLGEVEGQQYYEYSFDIHLNFYCLTENGFEPVDFCGPEFEPFIDGTKICDESLNSSLMVCCDYQTTNDSPADPNGGSGLKANTNNKDAENLNKINFEFNDASVSITRSTLSENLGFQIIDLNGQLIKRGQIHAGSNMQTIFFNADMKTGIYLIRVYSSEGIITKKSFKS